MHTKKGSGTATRLLQDEGPVGKIPKSGRKDKTA